MNPSWVHNHFEDIDILLTLYFICTLTKVTKTTKCSMQAIVSKCIGWKRESIENMKMSKLQKYGQKGMREILNKNGDNKAVNGVG